jgi:hypothetical protein
MMNTVQVKNWVESKIGTFLDFDGQYGNQCVDFYNYYLKECLDIQNPINAVGGVVNYAVDIFRNFSNDSTLGKLGVRAIINTPDLLPKFGDIIIYNTTKTNQYGHVEVFLEGDLKKFVAVGQNTGKGTGIDPADVIKKINRNYNNVLGILNTSILITDETMSKYEIKLEELLKDEVWSNPALNDTIKQAFLRADAGYLAYELTWRYNDILTLKSEKEALQLKLDSMILDNNNLTVKINDLEAKTNNLQKENEINQSLAVTEVNKNKKFFESKKAMALLLSLASGLITSFIVNTEIRNSLLELITIVSSTYIGGQSLVDLNNNK